MIILLFYVLVINMSNLTKFDKIWIFDPWYYKEELLILHIKCWNTFRYNGPWWCH